MAIQVQELQLHVCDVCRLVDGDVTEKLCGFCGMCDSWICKDDTWRWDRRVRAFYKRRVEPGFKGMLDYDKKAVSAEELEKINNVAKPDGHN